MRRTKSCKAEKKEQNMNKGLKIAALMLLTSCCKITVYAGSDEEVAETTEMTETAMTSETDFLAGLKNRIAAAKEAGTSARILKSDDINALPLEIIQMVVAENVTLEMEYTYEGVDYSVNILGAEAAVDENVPIYGPLFLADFYGKRYIVNKGDTLGGIAAVNNTTVAKIAALNPEIRDVNIIYPGQRIRVR